MPKRPDKTGSVYVDGRRGTFVGEVVLDGKRRRVTGPNRTETGRRLQALIREHARGELSDGSATVGQVIELWRKRVVPARDYSSATVDAYDWSCARLTAELGTVRLKQLDVERVEAALDSIAEGSNGKPLARSSLKHMRSTLGQVLQFAQRRKLIGSNPARVAELPPTAARPVESKSLDADQARQLWDALEDEGTMGALFRLQLETGLRPGEAAGICWDSLDLDATPPRLTVRRAVRTDRGRARLVDRLKTSSSYRTIAIPPEAVAVLRAQRVRVAEQRLAAATDWADLDMVFPSPSGRPLDPANRRRTLSQVCAKAGLPAMSPNELRHTAATVLVDKGIPIELVADLLGHTNFRMLAEHYRHRVRPVVDITATMPWEVAT